MKQQAMGASTADWLRATAGLRISAYVPGTEEGTFAAPGTAFSVKTSAALKKK